MYHLYLNHEDTYWVLYVSPTTAPAMQSSSEELNPNCDLCYLCNCNWSTLSQENSNHTLLSIKIIMFLHAFEMIYDKVWDGYLFFQLRIRYVNLMILVWIKIWNKDNDYWHLRSSATVKCYILPSSHVIPLGLPLRIQKCCSHVYLPVYQLFSQSDALLTEITWLTGNRGVAMAG